MDFEKIKGGGKTLLILGASGHGRVVEDLARKTGVYQNIYFLDDNIKIIKNNKSIIGMSNFPSLRKGEYDVVIAAGNSVTRKKCSKSIKKDESGL